MLPRRADATQNLDSLLDTMANVVGILVVVMAVTQIHVGDAMKRIRLFAGAETETLRERADALREEWSRVQAEGPGVRAEAQRLASALQQLRAAPAISPAERTQLEDRLRRLEAENAERSQSLAALRVRLSDMRDTRSAFPGQIRLPDPRPAPPGAQREVFFCRRGRVAPVDLDGLEAEASAELQRLQHQGLGPRDLVNGFAVHDIGNSWLRWRLFVRGQAGLFGRLEWRRERVGESARELGRPDSAYRRQLAGLEASRRYLVYYVWGDSFAEYLEARSLAEAAGFAAGWVPIEADGELEYQVGPRQRDPVPVD